MGSKKESAARLKAGPDPHFPYLSEHERIEFPAAGLADSDIIALGGNLSPGMLLSAYEQGIFPWYNDGEPLTWQSPDPRFVLFPSALHISRSMRKVLCSGVFDVRFNTDFHAVITACAALKRAGQHGTWINSDIINAYTELFKLGYACCAESYLDGELAGGCYGVLHQNIFFGESMFSRRDNASKAAFLTLAEQLFAQGIMFIDCQIPTVHLRSLGGVEIPRREFLALLKTARQAAVPSRAVLLQAGQASDA